MEFASDLAYLSDNSQEDGHESVDEAELDLSLDGDDQLDEIGSTLGSLGSAHGLIADELQQQSGELQELSQQFHRQASRSNSGSGFSGMLGGLFGGGNGSRNSRRDRRSLRSAAPPAAPQQQQQQAAAAPAAPAAPAPPPPPQRRKERRRYHRKVDTNIMNINLGTITSTATIATGEANECSGCGACASNLSTLTKVPSASDDTYEWKCEFCGESQVLELDEAELPVAGVHSVDYIIEPAAAVEGATVGASGEVDAGADAGGLVLFVVDTSGSMCVTSEVPGSVTLKGDRRSANNQLRREHGGDNNQFLPGQRRDVTYVSRMQAVQAAINAQIEAMANDASKRTKVGLITFSNEVIIYGDGTGQPITVAGDRLNDMQALLSSGQDARARMGLDVRESATALGEAIFGLEESGPTALGPAVAVALGMVSGSNAAGARIVLCTDGLANVGLGSLDEIPEGANPIREAAEGFYRSLGESAVAAGTVVDVISIIGQDADLENLGAVSEATGGTVTRVDPVGLQQDFAGILQNPVVATNVSVKVLLHAGMQFREQSEAMAAPTPAAKSTAAAAAVAEDAASGGGGGGGGGSGGGAAGGGLEASGLHSVMQKLVGNATADSELSFEYMLKPRAEREKIGLGALDMKELPFQVQIRYTNLRGDVCMRVMSQYRATTKEKSVAERVAKVEMLMTHNMQQSGFMAGEGDYTTAQVNNRAYSKLMRRCAQTEEDKGKVGVWQHNAGLLDNELRSAQLDNIQEASTTRLSFGAKAGRKAARSKNDTLSAAIYKSKGTSSKKMSSLW